MTAGHGACIQHLHSPTLHSQLLKGRVSIAPYTTNTTLDSIPRAAGAAIRATTFVVVDEDDRGLLITRRTIRTPIISHVGDTKRVVPFSETIEFERERERDGEEGMERYWAISEGLLYPEPP